MTQLEPFNPGGPVSLGGAVRLPEAGDFEQSLTFRQSSRPARQETAAYVPASTQLDRAPWLMRTTLGAVLAGVAVVLVVLGGTLAAVVLVRLIVAAATVGS